MKPTLSFIRLRGLDIFSQLHIEERLLRTTNANCVIFSQSSNSDSSSIVLGFSGKKEELVDLEEVNRHNLSSKENARVSLIRRFTGGGTVIVDRSTIFVSFIMNSANVPSPPYPREIMAWTEKIYNPVFSNLFQQNHLRNRAIVPKFSLREHDYVVDDKKIGGNAQTITKDRFVHHTSFLWDFDERKMNFLKLPKKRPSYRGDRKHSDFITTLSDKIVSVDDFERELHSELEKHYIVSTHSNFDEIFENFTHDKDSGKEFKARTVIESLID